MDFYLNSDFFYCLLKICRSSFLSKPLESLLGRMSYDPKNMPGGSAAMELSENLPHASLQFL